ncbi:MAG: FAD-binding protein [Bacteroides sp.]|nr:FAD-binding protein [Bacteroides sp.]
MITNRTIKIRPEKSTHKEYILEEIAKASGIAVEDVNDFIVVRRSVDARKHPIMFNLSIQVATGEDKKVTSLVRPFDFKEVDKDAPVAVIVGSGPAGLFAALEAIKCGIRPIVLERGKSVDERRLDLANISREKKINPVSNYCFGEGGAGTYSDGKLYTRSKKRGSVEDILQILVQHGAPESILIDAHPHIGSDKLPNVIKAIRETIIKCGGEVHFETKVEEIIIESGTACGVKANGVEYRGDGVILATGHSAHDTFKKLYSQGVPIEPKGIAIGVRLEHPQELIDQIQYKSKKGRGKFLPPAEYSFVTQSEGRGVYSFCMCPGGVIVPAGSDSGELVVNGMSASARAGKWANSGMVVELHPGDIEVNNPGSSLEMLEVQETLERKMYEMSGNSIIAPAQRMKDFVDGKISASLPATSYAPGIQSKDFNQLLPEFISKRLKDGFKAFGRKAKGFLTNQAVLIGLESRTSSPIRIVRDSNRLESVGIKNLYPAGEGAGYAGGIVSAAIDGMRCAKAFALNNNIVRDTTDNL